MNKTKSYDLDDLKSRLNYNPNTGIFTWKTREEPCGNFNTMFAGKVAGGLSEGNGTGYVRVRYRGKCIKAHRLAWAFMTGTFPDKDIDHINGDPTDNRWCNLREVSRIDNGRNQKMYKSNTTGIVGVYFHKGKGKWVSQIGSGRSRKSLGTYEDRFEAICARKSEEAKQGYHENHGRLK